MSELSILAPVFEKAYWRSLHRVRYRDLPAFEKKKGHYEPEEISSFANRWAAELSTPDAQEEIRQIYENSVNMLKNKRSSMERSARELVTPQFRYTIEANQDGSDPSYVVIQYLLWIKSPLNELAVHFDDIFLHAPEELVVPYIGNVARKEMLELLEHWESALHGRLEESPEGDSFRLWLKSGFSMKVDLSAKEVCFSKSGVLGALQLAAAVAQDLRDLGFKKQLQ